MLVDLPAGTDDQPTFTSYDFAADQVATALGAFDIEIGGRPVRLDLGPARQVI